LRSCWAGEGLWAYQEGQIGQKWVRFGQLGLGAARSRQDEPIERRPKEQETQDAHENHLRGCGYSLVWPLKPTPMRGDATKSPLFGASFGLGVAQPGRRAAAQGVAQGGGVAHSGPRALVQACRGGERGACSRANSIRIRPSSGDSGGHVVCWGGLISWLLPNAVLGVEWSSACGGVPVLVPQ
jgi:hypothetical protein